MSEPTKRPLNGFTCKVDEFDDRACFRVLGKVNGKAVNLRISLQNWVDEELADDFIAHIVKCVNERERLVAACEAVPMFYQPWSPEWQKKWDALTGNSEAHTRGLCDFVRAALVDAEVEPETVAKPVELVVGEEYEVIDVHRRDSGVKPDFWFSAECLYAGDVCQAKAPLFAVLGLDGQATVGRRVKGEYRRRVAEVTA